MFYVTHELMVQRREDHGIYEDLNSHLLTLTQLAEESDDNKIKYKKKQRNLCVNLRKKAIKQHIRKVTDSGIIENKKFWEVIKPFVTNKNGLSNNNITLIRVIPNPPTNRPQTTDHLPLTTDHLPPTTDHRPPTTDHRPPTTDQKYIFRTFVFLIKF